MQRQPASSASTISDLDFPAAASLPSRILWLGLRWFLPVVCRGLRRDHDAADFANSDEAEMSGHLVASRTRMA